MKTTRVLFSSLVLSSAAVAATDDALRPIAFQNGVNQQALGTETAALAREITALIEELQRNGFPLQSLNALTELAAQLQSLGGTEMSGIAARLRKLGESAQADPRATATEAYLAQQAIETRLKTLARQISIQQLREETARRLEALITRQLAIQRETKAIATAKPDAERQRLLESDQSGIGEDLATFFQTGENLLARLRETSATPAAATQTFAERINAPLLTTLSTEAVTELKGKRYPTAYGRQESLVVELRKILQGILSSLPKEQRLASALQQVSALLQQQQAADQAQTPATPETNQQAADQAQNLANQVAPLSPQAAAALQQAQAALQNPQSTPPPSNSQAQNQQAAQPTPPNQAGAQQAANQPQNPQGQQAASQQPNQAAQADPAQPEPGSQQKGDPEQGQPNPSAATAALAAAQAALQNALAQAQQQNSQQGQQPGQPQGQQQAGAQQQPGQPQNGQQQTAQGQQQSGQQSGQQQQQGQGRQTAQNGQQQLGSGQLQANGQPPGDRVGDGRGDAQNQIANHGPDAQGSAETVGALRREEREAFTALQGERYPAEYSAWVQQYWRNLARDQ